MTMLAALLLMAAAPSTNPPSPEAEALGLRLARSGTLAALLPLVSAKETEELVKSYPELSAEEQAKLRAVAERTAHEGVEKLLAAEGHAFATQLSVEDLRVLVAHAESDAAQRQRAAMPQVIMDTMQLTGQVDFKGETRKAFCRETGKLCGG